MSLLTLIEGKLTLNGILFNSVIQADNGKVVIDVVDPAKQSLADTVAGEIIPVTDCWIEVTQRVLTDEAMSALSQHIISVEPLCLGIVHSYNGAYLMFSSTVTGAQRLAAKVAYDDIAKPVIPYLKLSWSGNGAVSPSDGVYEMTTDGVNKATLTLQKQDRYSDTPLTGSGESYGVGYTGVSPDVPVGVITLDATGKATLDFTPASTSKGITEVEFRPTNSTVSPDAKATVRFV